MIRKILAGLLSIAVLMSVCPAYSLAEGEAVYISARSLEITAEGTYTVTGSTTSNTITVDAPGQDVAIELNGVTIDKSDGSACAFDIKAGNVTVTLTGTNNITSYKGFAGIHVARGATLTIEGEGSLEIRLPEYRENSYDRYAYPSGACIGGNSFYTNDALSEDLTGAGTIIIKSGNITVYNQGNGAGIGTGKTLSSDVENGYFEAIVIEGGNINAETHQNGAAIGTGDGGSELGYIKVTGGVIHAKGGSDSSHDIGSGRIDGTATGRIELLGGIIYSESHGIDLRYNSDDVIKSNVLIIDEKKQTTTVYGDFTIEQDFTFESGYTLTVPEDAKLTVAEGTTLTVGSGATLENNGVVINNGTITGDGRITGNGEFTGNRVGMAYIKVTAPTFDDAVVGYETVEPKELTIQNAGGKTVTITRVSFDGDSFSLDTAFEESSLDPDDTARYSVRPRTGLKGENTAAVEVAYNYMDESTATAEVSFTARYFAEGDGTRDDPYLIRDLAALERFRDYVNDGNSDGEYFKLTENIDMSDKYGENRLSWTPIGNGDYYWGFEGTFDGGGHTVSGVYVKSDDGYYKMFMGFFGQISSSGIVKNLNISGAILAGDCYFVGGVAGDSSGTVENCYFSGTVEGSDYVGGVAGDSSGTVENCYFSGTVEGSNHVGGIAGDSSGTVENCFFSGTVDGMTSVGGIVGDSSGSLENCFFSGTVDGMMSVGGIAGEAEYDTILNCYNTGSVTGSDTVGGIAGIVRGANVSNCYSTGTVTADDNAGGIAGVISDGKVTDCYYLDTCGAEGSGTKKTAGQFASGEVAYLLQKEQLAALSTQVWGQNIGTDASPVLTSDAGQRVWKVEFRDRDDVYAVKYANPAGIKELPVAPAREGYSFSCWSQTDSTDGVRFDTDTEISGDITVYAVYQATFGGESDTITRAETYGYESAITVKLDDYVAYQSGIPAEGRFEYTISSDADSTGASISAGVLTIPTGLAAGEYTITVTATEKEPQLSLMSVGSYGTGPVTLTVKVTVNKAQAAVPKAPATNNAIYNGSEQPLVEAGEATGGTMQYSFKEEGPYSDAVPTGTDVGTYTVWYRVKGDENHLDADPRSVTVTVGKADANVTVEPVAGQYGEDITVTATVSAGDVPAAGITGSVAFTAGGTELGVAAVKDGAATLTVSGDDVEKQKALFGESGASTLTAAYSGNDNITGGSGDGTATVNKRALTYTVTAEGREYRPGDMNVTVRLTPKNLLAGDSVTLTAKGNLSGADADTYESVSLTEITIGGRDKAYYTVADKADNVTLTSPVIISKTKAIVETPPTGKEGLTYTGDPLELLTGGATSKGGTMQYYVSEKGDDIQPDEAADWVENISDIKAADAGTYTVWYRANGNIDYATSDLGSITVTVGKADANVTVEPVAGQYGEDITVTATVSAGVVPAANITGSVTFTAGGTELGMAIVKDGGATLTIPGNEAEKQKALFGEDGASTLTAAYSGNDNLNGANGDGAAAVSKRALTYTVTAEGREYRPGDTAVTVLLTPENLLEGDSVTLTATGNVAKADAGTYDSVSLTEVTIGGDDAKYYTVDTENTASVSVTISRIRAEVVTPPTGAEGLTYTGEPQNLLTGGAVCSGGTMQYFVSEKGDDTQPDETADWVENISDIKAADAGTYTIWYRVTGDGNHSDVAPASLQVTVLPFTLSFEALDASAPYTGSAVTAPVSQTEGETPAIDPANIKISYLRDGERVEPVEPGTYDVTVSISDPNFALPGGAESVRAGTLTVTHVHAWSETEWASDNNFHWRVCTGVGQCPEGGVLQRVPHTFSEPVLSDGEYVYTCTVCDRAFTAPTESYSVTGKVLDSSGSVVSGVTVTLKRGSETLAATVANDGGEYLFLYVLPGTYNIVAEKDDITMTALAVVTSDQTVDDITMPAGPINSVLEVKPAREGQPETPAVVVGGLDQEAAKQSESGSTVTVSMTVEARAEESEDNSEEVKKSIEAIKAEAIGTDLEFIEISVQKTVSAEGQEDETTPIHETQGVITLLIPYDFTGKGAVTVYRYHDNATETLSEGEGSDGTFRLDRENGLVYVYTSKFSTYAIGCSQEEPSEPSEPDDTPTIYYTVTIPTVSGGSVRADRADADAGQRVTITVTPDFLWRLKSLRLIDRYGDEIPCTDKGDGTFTFIMPYSDVKVEAEFEHICPSLDFADLDIGAWYHDYTDYVIASDLMRGVPGGLFAPGGTVTRAQMVTVLWNMSGDPVVNYYMTYPDVSEEAWYAEAVRWATSEGIADGYGNGRFGPDDPLTREQMAVMLYRYEQKYGDGGFTGEWMYRLPFTDLDQISDWAFEAVAWCNMKGIITGKDENIFDPKGPAKRSELAAILTRYCDENVIN